MDLQNLIKLSSWGWIHHLTCNKNGDIVSELQNLCDFLHLPLEKSKTLSLYDISPIKSHKKIQSILSMGQEENKDSISIYSQLPPFPKTMTYDFVAHKSLDSDDEIHLFLHKMGIEKAHNTSHRLMDLGLLTAGFFHDLNNHMTDLIFTLDSVNPENVEDKKKHLSKKLALIAEQSHQVTSFIKEDSSIQKSSSALKGIELTTKMFKLGLPKLISCKADISFSKADVPLSSGAFCHIILNLLNNAREALEGNEGEILIQASIDKKDNSLKVTISDTGPGIRDEEMPYLFSPFYSKKNLSSNGLGLAVTKQLIELAGGSIWCESLLNSGASFHISLPIIEL